MGAGGRRSETRGEFSPRSQSGTSRRSRRGTRPPPGRGRAGDRSLWSSADREGKGSRASGREPPTASEARLEPAPYGSKPNRVLAPLLPCEHDAVHGHNAQTPVVPHDTADGSSRPPANRRVPALMPLTDRFARRQSKIPLSKPNQLDWFRLSPPLVIIGSRRGVGCSMRKRLNTWHRRRSQLASPPLWLSPQPFSLAR